MERKKSSVNRLSVLLFVVGVVIAIALVGVNTWGDLEAAMFDSFNRAESSIKSLDCPALMTTSEVSTVTASFSSKHVRPIERRIKVNISAGSATWIREEKAQLPLSPGKTERLHFEVDPKDAAYDQFILVRVYMFPSSTLESEGGSCGIMVIDFPYFTGGQIMTIGYVLGTLALSIGFALWHTNNQPLLGRPASIRRAMILLGGNMLVGMIGSYLGWWVLGILSLTLTVLMIITIPIQLMVEK